MVCSLLSFCFFLGVFSFFFFSFFGVERKWCMVTTQGDRPLFLIGLVKYLITFSLCFGESVFYSCFVVLSIYLEKLKNVSAQQLDRVLSKIESCIATKELDLKCIIALFCLPPLFMLFFLLTCLF